MDAGCGLGSETILCGIFGGKATGVDITKNYIDVAKKRVGYYENKLNIKIDVKFKLENVINHSGNYDIIWVNESISHIEPVNEFLERCYKNLKFGGYLIIADGNYLNPYTYLYSKKEQKAWGRIYAIKKDPTTGKNFTYAVERFFTIPKIKQLVLRKFKIISIKSIGFFPYFIFNQLKNF